VLSFLQLLRRAGKPSRRRAGPRPGGTSAEAPGRFSGGEAAPGGQSPQATQGVLACIINFSGQTAPDLPGRAAAGGPVAGDRQHRRFGYGGSGVGNLGSVEAVPEPWHGQPASAVMTLPPMGALWLVPDEA